MRRAARSLVFVLSSAFLVLSFFASVLAHDRITTRITWERDIAPIVQARCVSCHSPGGKAPMPLITYEEARPWAKAIKEEVLARRMPKWPIVRGYGDFINDHSLSSFEIALMAAWADGGAPRNLELRTKNSEVSETKGDEPPKNEERRTRNVSLPCDRVRIPPGRLVGLRPSLPAGESLRLTVIRPGREEILLWLKDFDPRFEETYWLRNPVTVTRATQFRAEAAAGCTLTALLETRKRK